MANPDVAGNITSLSIAAAPSRSKALNANDNPTENPDPWGCLASFSRKAKGK